MPPLTWSLGVPVSPAVPDPSPASWRRITRKPRLFLGCRLIVALWDGGKTAAELAAITGRPVLAMWAALRSMEAYGKVRRDGDLWRLV